MFASEKPSVDVLNIQTAGAFSGPQRQTRVSPDQESLRVPVISSAGRILEYGNTNHQHTYREGATVSGPSCDGHVHQVNPVTLEVTGAGHSHPIQAGVITHGCGDLPHPSRRHRSAIGQNHSGSSSLGSLMSLGWLGSFVRRPHDSMMLLFSFPFVSMDAFHRAREAAANRQESTWKDASP